MDKTASTELYDQHCRLIHERVWTFVRGGMDKDEALSTCHASFLKCTEQWDATRGEFSTLLWWMCTNAMISLGRKKRPENIEDEVLMKMTDDSQAGPREALDWKDRLASLSEEARMVVDIVIDSPEEMLHYIKGNTAPSGQRIKAALRRLLRDKHGWKSESVSTIFNEIEVVVMDY